jgi:hypothetical protein
MKTATTAWLAAALVAYGVFIAAAKGISAAPPSTGEMEGSVVLPPALQTVIYLGDPFLAANVEVTRVLATGGDLAGIRHDYFHRLHLVVAALNRCHEDNYYVANGLLAWAGGADAAISILEDATRCRFWDEVPPFFLGYNLYFFRRQHQAAKDMLFAAAERSPENRAGLQRFGIILAAEALPDVRTARNYLVSQRDQVGDQKLKTMLEQRIGRLDGLIVLRDAQVSFEKRFGRGFENPAELLTSGILQRFPEDPMRLGYEYSNGVFSLKELRVPGMEEARR